MTDPAARTDGTGADPATESTEPAEASRALLPMPVDVRSVSLAVLATLASVFMLHWASVVFIPVCVGLLFSYALSPLVDWLQRRRIPRALSAALLIVGLFSGFGAILYSLSDDASQLVERLPAAAQKLRDSINTRSGKPDNALETVQKAATRLEQAAEASTPAEPVGRGVQRVQIEKPRFDIKDHLWDGTLGVLGVLYQIGMVAIFVGVFAWGWLWGVWGLLLAVPMLVIIKAICDRVDDLKPVGEFLGA